MGVAHFLDIGGELACQGFIGEEAVPLVFIAPLPRSQVTLVDADCFLSRILLSPLPHPSLILPAILPGLFREFRRRARAEFRTPCKGIGLIQELPRSTPQGKLIEHARLKSRNKALPNASLKNRIARICLCFPVVKISDHAHCGGMRRPNRKVVAKHAVPRHGMRAELFINLVVRALTEQIAICLRDDPHTSVDLCHTPSVQMYFILQV